MLGTGNYNYVVTPSTLSTFTFSNTAGTDTIQINTPIGNIAGATSNFLVPATITFNNGFKTWTNSAAGATYIVTPTVP